MKQRRKNLIKFTKKNDCDTLVAFEPENLFYMTGFWGEAIGILEQNSKVTIIAPKLEVDRVKKNSVDCNVIESDRGATLISTIISKLKSKSVCTDCQNYGVIQSLKKSIKKIKLSSEPFYLSRIIKDSTEISTIKKASRIVDEMFDLCTNLIKVGQRETELQAKLMGYAIENEMFDTGYKSTLNPLIIASGANGALPHAQVTKRKFSKGDMIVVDLTLRYKGYVTDATRTFGLGTVSKEAKFVYDVVKDSQELGLKKVRVGIDCKTIDCTCREYITKKKYGKFFIHSTGHGVGLEVHEPPTISSSSTARLQQNMVVTIEPGIYIPNKFGVRIEDTVLVKQKGVSLHKFTKDLILI